MEEFSEVKIIDPRDKRNIRTLVGIKLRPALDGSGDYYVVSSQDDSVSLYITSEIYKGIVSGKCNRLSI